MIRLAVIGLGNRGRGAYLTNFKKYSDIEITALCDTNPATLEAVRAQYAPNARCFADDAAFFAAGQLADWLVIATPDNAHYPHARAALNLGYHLLLEKPVTAVPAQLDELVALAKEQERRVIVCHVLRYSPFFGKIKELLDEGAIGELVSVNHQENVGYWHYAHSYVRGNWRNTEVAAPFLLAKCCHDFDLLQWLVDRPCESIACVGGQSYFREKNAPDGAPSHCMDGCPAKDCPYHVERLYLKKLGLLFWARPTITGLPKPTIDQTRELLRKGDYGRCVFRCDNNVNDRHGVLLRFAGDIPVNFQVNALTRHFTRRIQLFGTKGELTGQDTLYHLRLKTFGKGAKTIPIKPAASGHLGADPGICDTVHRLMCGENVNEKYLTTIDVTAQSHKLVYAALASAESGETVKL